MSQPLIAEENDKTPYFSPGAEQIIFRVVTIDMKSLGLRNNPHIVTYTVGKWLSLPWTCVLEGKADWGGLWAARTYGTAKKYVKYMKAKHNMSARVFLACADRILFQNGERVKTNALFLIDEIDPIAPPPRLKHVTFYLPAPPSYHGAAN